MFTRNVAVTGFTFGLVNATDGSAVTTGTPTELITKDGGAQAAMTNNAVHEGNGQWSIDITAGEMDAVVVGLLFTHADAIPVQITIKTTTIPSAPTSGVSDVNTIQISGDQAAADNFETMLDGTGGQVFSLKQLNIVNSTGTAFIASSTGSNGRGMDVSGNGTGEGARVTGGSNNATAMFFNGSNGTGGQVAIGEADDGILIQGVQGHGINTVGGISNGSCGIRASSIATTTAGWGARFIGSLGGGGIRTEGGVGASDVGPGFEARGGVSGGEGMILRSLFAGADGLKAIAEGVGNGSGANFFGGSSNGPGMRIEGGGGNATGLVIQAKGIESGARLVGGAGSPGHALSLETVGNGNAIRALMGGGGEPLSQNIEDQLAGAVTGSATVQNILKILKNRLLVDEVGKTMTIFDDDDVTPIFTWNLFDSNAAPSVIEVFERVPV